MVITIISGTDRPKSSTLKIASIVKLLIEEQQVATNLIDLSALPESLFSGKHYGSAPESFLHYQKNILETDGIISVVPEYNGSFPGALKYFIDLLKFPESLYRKPSAFIGLAAGQFGGVRAVEHLEMVFNYREANLFGQRVFFPRVYEKISGDGKTINDPFIKDLMSKMIAGFIDFTKRLKK